MRPDWDQYFMDIAKQAATRATCDRKHVGAVIVRDKCILTTGYNGSIRGLGHCDEEGHLMEEGHCVRTVHAEANAVAQAARNGVALGDSILYVTASPCWPCFKLVVNAGVVRIVFGEFYRDERIFRAAKESFVELVELGELSTYEQTMELKIELDEEETISCKRYTCPECKYNFVVAEGKATCEDLCCPHCSNTGYFYER